VPAINKPGTRASLDSPPGSTGTPLVRLRVAITLFYALGGFIYAGWAVRIPAIKEQTQASPQSLGLALFCMTAAAVASMALTGRLCWRVGSYRMTIATAALLSATVFLSPLAHSALTLGLVLIAFGAAYGGIDVAVNSVALELIAALRRPIMPTLHAANSLGSLAGAGLGGLLAVYLSPTRHLLLIVPVGLLATAVGGRMLLAHRNLLSGGGAGKPDRRHAQSAGPAVRRIGQGVVLFGSIGLCAAYSQGALDTWVPLHINDDLGGSPSTSAVGYATVALTLAVGRLFGTPLLERFGQTRVVVTGAAAAGVGMVLAALSPDLWLVFVGLATTGLGLANIFPVAMARAGALGGPSGVAMASTLGYSGILVAPPSIGFLAQAFGLPIALNAITLLVVVSGVIAYAARHMDSRGTHVEPAPGETGSAVISGP
jgi:MFS family permease